MNKTRRGQSTTATLSLLPYLEGLFKKAGVERYDAQILPFILEYANRLLSTNTFY
jgi:hypothetical protein